jgi:hypothetical protein
MEKRIEILAEDTINFIDKETPPVGCAPLSQVHRDKTRHSGEVAIIQRIK